MEMEPAVWVQLTCLTVNHRGRHNVGIIRVRAPDGYRLTHEAEIPVVRTRVRTGSYDYYVAVFAGINRRADGRVAARYVPLDGVGRDGHAG